ncbi:MAG: aminomethyltransferase beta-barrel domain-containing protein [Ilumatobacteraceae bacterium]
MCFITHTGGREQFLGDRIPFHRADGVDRAGRPLGSVDAVELVTIGQRRGIGLPGGGPKRYVVDVDIAAQRVVVDDDAALHVASTRVRDTGWAAGEVAGDVLVQCSAHGASRPAVLVGGDGDGTVEVHWQHPERRVAPGQSVVFYDLTDERVLGGGIAA